MGKCTPLYGYICDWSIRKFRYKYVHSISMQVRYYTPLKPGIFDGKVLHIMNFNLVRSKSCHPTQVDHCHWMGINMCP